MLRANSAPLRGLVGCPAFAWRAFRYEVMAVVVLELPERPNKDLPEFVPVTG